ncbi:hypothetical protein A4H97_09180 [Niastella yeongjuensis]|uniref:Lipoprotein n=1 Tax=Niastella yeongjuensis TaxID=354355 RepID=A0A1V9EF31_9BACT|nr:hypothetical protein [Niastella yeongjuensis]OQP44535.1 hypothetical protein A4H97_09180 [Niastella yeongjuensis]SEO84364.1 hypothetical protein SAMN05660816_03711 [Niastella yeongjuensis]
MKLRILLPLVALTAGIVLFSCSKDDNNGAKEDQVLDKYLPGTTMEIKDVAIYTKDGVIRDAAAIQGYMDRNLNSDMKARFYVGVSNVPVPQDNTNLSFLDNNRVNINGINKEITAYKDSVMLISDYVSSPTPSYGISSCSDLFAKIPAYTPFYGCPDSSCATYRETNPIITDGNKSYFIPLITYAVTTSECTFYSASWPMVNTLSNNFQSALKTGDTVLVQYAKLPLVHKTGSGSGN